MCGQGDAFGSGLGERERERERRAWTSGVPEHGRSGANRFANVGPLCRSCLGNDANSCKLAVKPPCTGCPYRKERRGVQRREGRGGYIYRERRVSSGRPAQLWCKQLGVHGWWAVPECPCGGLFFFFFFLFFFFVFFSFLFFFLFPQAS